MQISIIVPALNEAENIVKTLYRLQPLRARGHQVILVDGGSDDGTVSLAAAMVDKVIASQPGRAQQMNNGSKQATGDVLWFLHSDTLIPANADQIILSALSNDSVNWGHFKVKLSGQQFAFRIIEFLMNRRSHLTGIATGDLGIFVRSSLFHQFAGFKPIALMEDIEFSKRFKKLAGRPVCVKHFLHTSSRRWEKHGIIKTVLLMWQLRLAYFFGAEPDKLKTLYQNNRDS